MAPDKLPGSDRNAPFLARRISRRGVLGSGLGFLAAASLPRFALDAAAMTVPHPSADPLDPFIADLQERTFRYFWDTTNATSGLAPDRYPSPSACSVAAIGFALTAWPIGIERGFIARVEGRERVLATLRFLHDAPQGPEPAGTIGHKGFFYHFLDLNTGMRSDAHSELSTVDTALLLGGVLFCQAYFNQRDDEDEDEIRRLAEAIYGRVDWRWAQARPPTICHGWSPEQGFMPYDWRGYNEAMIVYIMALGSPTYPVDPDAWGAWTSTYDLCWGPNFGEPHLGFPPLFGHQYSHTWIDFRKIQDAYMRNRGIDYFENNRRAVYAQQNYAIANPVGWKGYGDKVWGVTASDGPGGFERDYDGKRHTFYGYKGRGAGGVETFDDGTVAPTAAVASIAFAPEIVIPTVLELKRRYGEHIYTKYGFLDSFNPSFDFDVPPLHGRCIPGFGWIASDFIGIDQGPIVAMIENYRSGLIWKHMRGNPHLRRGLERAGFSGGWLETTA